ncbi:MAG TPA: gluconate 2-dehydrogenase subunit 3 family protein [Caulobacteraceae bacterium]|nr:gluconate 2-dehydrogenase subunit 3 family protein [Caulobacteraceae bacterium]
MADRFPGYDVLDKRGGLSWNPATRRAIDTRLAVPREPRVFDPFEWKTLEAVCARILPQPKDRPAVPLAAYVDQKLAENRLDGYRYAELPPQAEAWRRGLAALDQEARDAHGQAFTALGGEAQDALLRKAQHGELKGEAWGGMPSAVFFLHRVLSDITHAYYAHPIAWNEIGFGGPASPRGYVRLQLDRRDPWEAVEARPGEEARARKMNRHVG